MHRAMKISSFDPNATHLKLKIYFSTGEVFDEFFDLKTTTFAHVKLFAIEKQFHQQINEQTNDYKLISIGSKRIVDENRKLNEENLRDGDEFLLMKKTTRKTTSENNLGEEKADASTIETRTKHLPVSSQSLSFFTQRRFTEEFRAGINRILISLIETSQKLLWFHPDAEHIFQQAEEILLRTSETSTETRGDLVRTLTEMGFTERQAQLALKRTNNDVHSAMDLLLNRPESIDDDDEDSSPSNSNRRIRLYNRQGPFVSVRKFQEENFRLNSNAVRSLKEMGFDENQIDKALRMFHNNKNLACEYLLSDENQQKTFEQNRAEQTLDPNSRLLQTIVQNAVVQRMLNMPKVFFVLLQLTENAGSITNFMHDPDIAQMLVEISRIYHSERDESSSTTTTTANSRGARQQSDDTSSSDDD